MFSFFVHLLFRLQMQIKYVSFLIYHSYLTKEAKEADKKYVVRKDFRSSLDLSICLERILKKVGRNSKGVYFFVKIIQEKRIQCLQKLIVITRGIIISRKSQIPNDRYAMSRSSWTGKKFTVAGWAEKNRFYLMTDYLCSQADRILTWFSYFTNAKLLI